MLYEEYCPELLTEEIRQWSENGIWEEEIIRKQISDR